MTGFWNFGDVIDASKLNMSLMQVGTLADRPAADTGNIGIRYYAIDSGILYRSNGMSWDQFFAQASTVSRYIVEGPISGGNAYITLAIPDDTKLMLVRGWGAGGGGSISGDVASVLGSGGGGGAYSEIWLEIDNAATYQVRAGLAGAADGGDGTPTQIRKNNEIVFEAAGGKGGTIPNPANGGHSLGGAGGSKVSIGIFTGGEEGLTAGTPNLWGIQGGGGGGSDAGISPTDGGRSIFGAGGGGAGDGEGGGSDVLFDFYIPTCLLITLKPEETHQLTETVGTAGMAEMGLLT